MRREREIADSPRFFARCAVVHVFVLEEEEVEFDRVDDDDAHPAAVAVAVSSSSSGGCFDAAREN